MEHLRDYGSISGAIAPEVPINNIRHSQVWEATHDREGNRLLYMERSFISFSFGGKNIEDFDLLAIIDGDFLQRNLYAEFGDNITESDVWDGQLYWSSHYNANTLPLVLFTDGIEQKQLDAFKQWFRSGHIEELIVSEHPNRAIMARIGEVSSYEMLPFEQKIETKIGGMIYQTSTTLYKGKINLNFVMDDPFWYSRTNILDEYYEVIDGVETVNKWTNANGNEVIATTDKDALKIIYEDNVPVVSMVQEMDPNYPILFGTEAEAIQPNLSYSAIGSRVAAENEGGLVSQAHVAYYDKFPQRFDLNSQQNGYFYYGGNAKAYPTLKFQLTPQLNEDGYICYPLNSYVADGEQKPYNTITIESIHKKDFCFTTPGIYTGYNQVINIFHTIDEGTAWEEIRVAIRDTVKHFAPRQYAMAIIDSVGSGTAATSSDLQACITQMKQFLYSSSEIVPATFIINSANGQATGTFTFRNRADSLTELTENVGDMVRSEYLTIEDTNHPDEDGYIQPYSEEHPEYSHKMTTDGELENVRILYKYAYL